MAMNMVMITATARTHTLIRNGNYIGTMENAVTKQLSTNR